MSAVAEVSELLVRWQELRQQGQRPSPEELCSGCPERAAELRRQIEALRSMEQFLGLGGPAAAPDVPDRLTVPGYEVLGVLAQGGMGIVYRARQQRLNRTVALKMLLAGPHADAAQRERFRREAEALASVQHPNVVQIHEVGEWEGRPFYAMEYVEGGSLAERLAGAVLPARQAADLVRALAAAMHAAHQRGVVHRDLKPANVLLQKRTTEAQRHREDNTERGKGKKQPLPSSSSSSRCLCASVVRFLPKIIDFGLAKLLDQDDGPTRSGAVLGTPSYMAPEQAEGKAREAGPAADIWALGAILYELLAGRPPFKGETTLDTLEQVRLQEPVPPRRLQPRVPCDLETICLKCLRKEPGRRYATAGELADDLGRFLDGESVRARPAPAWERGARWARRRPALAALVAVSAAAVFSLLALGGWFTAQLQNERDAALREQQRAESREQDARREREEAERQRERAQALLRQACALVDENAWTTIELKNELRKDFVPGGFLYGLACVYALASAATRSDAALTSEDRGRLAEQYAARAVELLSHARAAGYFANPARLSKLKGDKDLDALRPRPDFQKMLGGLANEPPAAAMKQ